MTLKECYAAMGGDYDEAMGRLRSEKLVQKFVLKFLSDQSYDLLCASMEAKNYEDAFRAAHTIKGVCQNLSFTTLGKSSSALSEALRGGYTPEADGLAEQVGREYQQTVAAIRAFQEAAGE
jgi:HPt (histidine-containing phosphotransfer) domain-containing protein